MTPELLAKATGAKLVDARAALPHLSEAMNAYQIVGPERAPRFLAQIAHESANLSRLVESLNYSPAGLLDTFGKRRVTEAQAQALGRVSGRPAQQEAIANLVYGGEWGRVNLGNTQPGDGWRYRGRGYKQITGRSNYRQATAALRHMIGQDFEANPEAAAEPAAAAWLAAWFWDSRRLNELADMGKDGEITRRINGGLTGHAERLAAVATARQVLA